MVFSQKYTKIKGKKNGFCIREKNSNDKTEQITKTNLSSIIGLQYSWHNAGS
jgi:hypothetical protein